MKTVTYKGANDPADKTSVLITEDGKFRKDQPVKVSNEVADGLDKIEGHKFDVVAEDDKTKED